MNQKLCAVGDDTGRQNGKGPKSRESVITYIELKVDDPNVTRQGKKSTYL